MKTAMITSKKVQAEILLPNSPFTGKIGTVVEAVSHHAAFIKVAFEAPVYDENSYPNWFGYFTPGVLRFSKKAISRNQPTPTKNNDEIELPF